MRSKTKRIKDMDKVKSDNLDDNSLLMLAIFQTVHLICDEGSGVSMTEYLKYCASDIARIGHVFKFLGLAEECTKSALGWKPTAHLIQIIAERSARPAKGSEKEATEKDRKLVNSLLQLAGGTTEEVITDDFFFAVLNALGFLREAPGGECKPTSLLHETIEAVFER
jgi:hypothetical protein